MLELLCTPGGKIIIYIVASTKTYRNQKKTTYIVQKTLNKESLA